MRGRALAPAAAARRQRSAPASAAAERGRDRQGRDDDRRAHPHAADDRAADGRVEGDDPRLHAADRRRHGGVRGAARRAKRALRRRPERRPTYNDMVVKACALALREHPRANGSYRDGQLQLHSRVNVGVAVAGARTRAGRADRVRRRREVARRDRARDPRAGRARARRARSPRPSSAAGPSRSRTSACTAISSFTAIINPPQAAILSVGALRAARRGRATASCVARHTMTLTLACDHRILYGAEAAQFLARIRELLSRRPR